MICRARISGDVRIVWCPNGRVIGAYATENMVQTLEERLLIRIVSISKSDLFSYFHYHVFHRPESLQEAVRARDNG
jgi:hypothetical protein